ncbi:unnamed protein product [Schistocephalus solidus]|uniref:Uncharacterized protein n=1 Tax=Schistocephalus solidus TaxID=70667 RepID=A0A3P7DET6_SCHSO|nr:unnamed protein product [Schistocephalus solidus]
MRQIVQRQKAEVATRERVSSSVLLANAEDKTAVAHPSMTFADTLPLTRKVAECSSPPAYRGFSSVIHISREGTYHSARSSAAQADLHTRSRKVAHPASARSAGMITASDWRLGNQLIQKFFGSKIEQSSISLAQSADHKSDRLVSPNSRSSPQKVDARVIEEEIRPDNPKGIDGGETALINSSIPDDGPRAVVGRSPYDQYHCNPPCDLVSIGSSFCLLATNSQDSARKQARSGQHQRSQRRQQQNNQEQAASTKTDRCAVVPVPDREALRALVRQQRKERHEKRQRDLEAAELSRARIAQNLQLTAQKAAAAANRRGRHGPPPHKASFGAWNVSPLLAVILVYSQCPFLGSHVR